MPWQYRQSSGRLLDPAGLLAWVGYSGKGTGENNPAAQAEQDVGPIPQGSYAIGQAEDSEKLGPVAIPLTLTVGLAFGRSGFFVHGDSKEHPGQASHGCIIIVGREVREKIANSPDKVLVVTA